MGKCKDRIIEVDNEFYERIPIATHLFVSGEDIVQIAVKYLEGLTQEGDWIVFSEKAVAATEGRAIPLDEIKPSRMATLLSKFVRKTPHGIGMSIPETMEMAIREVGLPRIMVAAALGAVTKAVGVRGVFYQVAGRKAAAIDGPTSSNIPPYDHCVILSPSDPDGIALKISKAVGCEVGIVDVNDLGSEVLGATPGIDRRKLRLIMGDNPLGQGKEQTPIGIIRRSLSHMQVAAAAAAGAGVEAGAEAGAAAATSGTPEETGKAEAETPNK